MIRLLEIVGCWEVMPVLILTPIQEYGYSTTTENETISTNFDKLAMYGVEFRARLNDRSNISGFGWGYLNPSTILGVNDVKVEGENLHPLD
jgi:hypothetical protein